MTANSAQPACLAQQLDCPLPDLSQQSCRKQEDKREAVGDICMLSKQGAGLRSGIQAVNTLRRSPLFARLRDEEIARINARCVWRRVLTGESLADQLTDGCALSVVTNGRVRAVKMMNGREIILRDIEEGECFGELSAIDGRPGSAEIVAITDAIVARMPSMVFRDALHQFPCFCDQVLASLVEQIRSMNDRLSEQIALTTRERLCVELLRLSRRTANERIVVSPPPSHAELAARIGGTRETVTKVLIAFEREGLITRSRGAIALIDAARLRLIAAPRKGAG